MKEEDEEEEEEGRRRRRKKEEEIRESICFVKPVTENNPNLQ